MPLEVIQNVLLLFLLGLAGWILLKIIHVPVPALLGTIIVIGTLRLIEYPLPTAPSFLSPLVQLMLGLFIGARFNRDVFQHLKGMIVPILIIISWALTVLFIVGFFLSQITSLDLYTAILSSSVAGLPEMTVLAMATGAEVIVVVLAQTLRMIMTVVTFPLIFKYWLAKKKLPEDGQLRKSVSLYKGAVKVTAEATKEALILIKKIIINEGLVEPKGLIRFIKGFYRRHVHIDKSIIQSISWRIVTLVIVSAGAFLFSYLGIPAGAMIGAMFFAMGLSLCGVTIKPLPAWVFILIQVIFPAKLLNIYFPEV